MNNIDRQYKELLEHILHFGVEKKDRTGTGTKSIFGWQIRHNMKEGFPLLTTKKMAWKSIVTELIWFLKGDTNIKYLVDNDCHIWDGDAYKKYLSLVHFSSNPYDRNILSVEETDIDGMASFKIGDPFTKEQFINKIKTDQRFSEQYGELGSIYGKQWRNWQDDYGPNGLPKFKPNNKIDQIANLISEIKTNPDSRRLMVNAWNVGELDQMVLPPCHYGFQVYTNELSLERRYNIWFNNNYETGMERFFDPNNLPNFDDPYYEPTPTRSISLMWNQRSVDSFLGLPFNIASYALLLEILAKEVNMMPEELIGNLGDVHLYNNHIEQALEQITRVPFDLPKLRIYSEFWQTESSECGVGPLKTNLTGFEIDDFQIENYQSHPPIKASLSN